MRRQTCFARRMGPACALADRQGSAQIALPLLYSVTRTPPSLQGAPAPLVLRTRDFSAYELHFDTTEELDGIWDSLKGLCRDVSSGGLEGLHAFIFEGEKKADSKGKRKAGWEIYQPEKEFARMGVGSRSKAWRFTNINHDFGVSHSSSPRSLLLTSYR